MFQNLTGWHALIILAVIVLIFGAAKLPALAKSVGQSMRILKNETNLDGPAVDRADVPAASAEPDDVAPSVADPGQPAQLRPASRYVAP